MMGFMIRGGVGTAGWSKYIMYMAEDRGSLLGSPLFFLLYFIKRKQSIRLHVNNLNDE